MSYLHDALLDCATQDTEKGRIEKDCTLQKLEEDNPTLIESFLRESVPNAKERRKYLFTVRKLARDHMKPVSRAVRLANLGCLV